MIFINNVSGKMEKKASLSAIFYFHDKSVMNHIYNGLSIDFFLMLKKTRSLMCIIKCMHIA